MRAGSWPSIGLIYFFGVLVPASLGKVIPMQADFAQHLGASPEAFGLYVSLLMLPAALLGAVGGGVVDRIGPVHTLVLSALIAALTNIGYYFATDMLQFQVLRIVEGIGLVGVFTAAPALIMATTSGQRRTQAMSLWTTYTPVGFSLGLALAAPFVGGPAWKNSFALHALLFIVVGLCALKLPRVARSADLPQSNAGRRWAALLDPYRQSGPLRLALAFGTLAFMGFGTSTVFPALFAQAQQVSIGTASSILAVCNLAMIAGSFLAGALCVRGVGGGRLMIACALGGVLASLGIFTPGVPAVLVVAALSAWLLVSGAAMAVVLITLSEVVDDPRRGAAAAGLLSQVAAIVTFVTPPIWLPILAQGQWWLMCGFVLVFSLLSVILLPTHRARAAQAALKAG